jgi:hypothetical protein
MLRLLVLLPVLTVATAVVAAPRADGILATMLRQAVAIDQPGDADMPEARIYDKDTLTRQTLKSCLILAHDLDAAEENIEPERERLRHVKGEVERLQNRLQAALKAANGARRAENDKLTAETTAKRRAFVLAANALEEAIESRNLSVGRFNSECAGRRYYAADLRAVRPELPFDLAPYAAAGR